MTCNSALCYCRKPFIKYLDNQLCQCCFQETTDNVNYGCEDWQNCKFQKISASPYSICSDCMNILKSEAVEHKHDDEMDESAFVMQKLRSSVNIIGLECIADSHAM